MLLTPRARRRVQQSLLALAFALGACEPGPGTETMAHPLVGKWVQVYPHRGALDTLVLQADGTARGSAKGLDSTAAFRITKWKIGDPLMPGGFCVGEGDQPNGLRLWTCQGFSLTGDTLALANVQQTVFLRVATSGPRAADSAWTKSLGADPVAPAPGDSVKVVPPATPR